MTKTRGIALALVLGLGGLWATAALAGPRTITMNFKDAEISAVVQFISELTGKNFILDDKVRGKVTVISPGKVTPEEAYEVFQAILKVKGFTLAPASENVLKIVSTRVARQTNIETVDDGAPPGDRFVTRLIRLAHVDAQTVSGILAPLVSKDSSIVAYAPTNTLIVIDSYSNIERLVRIISALDVKTVDTVFKVIPLRYASAETMAKNLSQALTEKGRTPRRRTTGARGKGSVQQVQAEVVTIKIIPDARTNSLIVIADPETLQEIESMIRELDVEIPKGTGKINVYYLKYADAENVASVLTAISKSVGTKAKPGKVQPKQQTTRVPVEFEEPVQITADKATNSLVIIASPRDYETLTAVIEKLDVRRPQVLVEAMIIEMSYEKSLELGVEWRTVNDVTRDQPNVFGGTNFGTITPLMQNPLSLPPGMFLGAVKGTITFNNETFLNVGALVRALQKTGDVNVLSTPHLLTTDNEEAEIVVSDNIPFQTSQKFDSNGNPIYTFEYRDVGLTLRITPQINEDDFVKLKLFQEISQIVSTTTGTSVNAPTTTRRSAKTTVVVKDNTTVVIGGLIKDNSEANISSVPCLGDIPVLGYLFRTSKNQKKKTNLLIFLTPHIIKNMAQITEITRQKREVYDQGLKDMNAMPPPPPAPAAEPEETRP